MTSIAKLKDRARKHEQKEDWKAAIGVYQQVLEAEEGQDELDLELGLYNRIGDLYLRLGRTDDAVSYYEQAADKYAEAGFLNNAIALCNKALRHRPERPQTYLKLSGLCLEQGFIIDARRWIIDYAEREVRAGHADAALVGLTEFVEESGDPDVREFLAQHLAAHGREQEAVEQLSRAYAERLERGETEAAEKVAVKARAIDPAVDLSAVSVSREATRAPDEDWALDPSPATGTDDETGAEEDGLAGPETGPEDAGSGLETGGIEGLEVSYSERGPAAAPEEVEEQAGAGLGELETFGSVELDGASDADTDPPGAGVDPVPDTEDSLDLDGDEPEPLPLVEGTAESDWDDEPVADLEEPLDTVPGAPETDAGEIRVEGLDLDADEPEVETVEAAEIELEGFDLDEDEAEEVDGVDLEVEALDEVEPAESEVVELDASEFDLEDLDPADEEAGGGAGSADAVDLDLLADGDTDAAAAEETPAEEAPTEEILAEEAPVEEPRKLEVLQRRVEEAEKSGDKERLATSYLNLAAGLEEEGAETQARAMYQRVLELDPGNEAAGAVVGPRKADEEEDAIDLDAILQEMAPEEAATLRAGSLPDPAEDPEFAAMLSQFKSKVAERVDTEDAGDHYDLGLAFKEMGLIDEAIAEFQTALTGGEERLKVYEELGQCFMQKGQYTVALKILDRALKVPHQDESELLGVHYHLGKCHEELGQREEAREAYQRVLEIDPGFQDVPDRVARL